MKGKYAHRPHWILCSTARTIQNKHLYEQVSVFSSVLRSLCRATEKNTTDNRLFRITRATDQRDRRRWRRRNMDLDFGDPGDLGSSTC